MLYGLGRATLVWRYLSGYGVNVAVFSTIEALSSLMYGWASSRFVLAIIDGDWRVVMTMSAPALASYAAPDVFVFISVGDVPAGIWRTLMGIIIVTACVTVMGVVLQVRRGRREQGQPAGQ